MANHNEPGGDWSWPLIIILFATVWPVGLLLLFNKLFGSDGTQREEAPPLGAEGQRSAGKSGQSWQQAAAQLGKLFRPNQTSNSREKPKERSQARETMKKVTKSPVVKKSNAWLLKIFGGALMLLGLFGVTHAFSEALFWEFEELSWWLPDLFRWLAVTVGGGAMLSSGLSMSRALKRYSRYLLVIGQREVIPIEELARTLGYSKRRVIKDLEKMLDKGYFGGAAYLNRELGYLFRSSNADAAFRLYLKRQEAAKQAAKETAAEKQETKSSSSAPSQEEEGYARILRNIRRANARIADPALSAKISRLEDITARIFRAVEEDPKKAERIGTFLNYYLPTTQKLLDSYAEFEAAGVEGENLRQAKQRIETTMDSIVRGFEHQLDELYKADALDVDTDIRVMEHMLRRDAGGAAQDFNLDFDLGGEARQEEKPQ
ncbi:MAG: hypothetical protein HFG00_04465 [Oscillibacter sp.]|nr:hypothetical protein [Oscillibacter sp.]